MKVFATAMEGVASCLKGEGMRHESASQRIFASQNKTARRIEIQSRLLIGPKELMLFEGLQSEITTASMALNTANIAFTLGEKYRLHFVLEVVEVQLYILCEEKVGTEQSE
jgi:hypothetical protein